MIDIILVKCLFFQVEVQQSNCIYMFKLEVPFCPLWSLFTDRKSRIEQRTILEILLISILHLNDELFTTLIFAIYVKDGLALGKDITNVLTIQVLHILNDLKTIKQGIQEIDEQILVRLCSKNTLKTEIGKQANISFLYPFHIHLLLKRLTEL